MDSSLPTDHPAAARRLLHPHVWLALLIAATLWARADVLDTPIGRVRATLTAMITRNLSRDLAEIGPRALLYPRVDYAGDQPGYLLQEFPLVNLAGVALEKAFDLAWEPAYRLPSLVCFGVMLAYLYALARRRYGTPEALAACTLAAWYPLSVYASVEVMPEQGVAAAFAAGMFHFDRYLDRSGAAPLAAGARRELVLATLAFALMLLVKSTSGLLFLLPAGLYLERRGTLRGLLAPRHLVAAGLCALPLVLWLLHATPVNRASRVDDGRTMAELIDNYLSQKERWAQLGKGKTYSGMWDMLVGAWGQAGIGLALAGIGLALVGRVRGRGLLLGGLLSLLVFMALLPFNTATHWYYTHGYVALFALAGACALGWLARRLVALVPGRAAGPLQTIAAVAALVWVLQASWHYAPPYEKERHELGQVLQQCLEPRALGILASEDTGPWDGETLWAGDVRGWRASTRKGLSRRPLSEAFVEERRQLGARFLAHQGPPAVLEERLPGWAARQVAAGRQLVHTPRWQVFALD